MSRYSNFAEEVYASGLGDPLPVSTKHKGPLVAGFHGVEGRRMTDEDVQDLYTRFAKGKVNIGIRLAEDIIGIDVDAHSGKKGDKSLRKLSKRYGPLPSTWVSTSRAFPNGIGLYRVGRKLAGAEFPSSIAGMPDIDLVSYRDMYVQCAPSIHQKTGSEYRWEHSGTGEVRTSPPNAADLPKLPKAWRKAIMGAEAKQTASSGFEAYSPGSVSSAIASDDEDAVAYAVGVLEGTADLRGDHASRHKAVAAMVLRLTFNEDEEGIDEIKAAWFATMPDERGKKEAAREWRNIVKSAQDRADEPQKRAEPSVRVEQLDPPKKPAKVNGSFPMDVLPTSLRVFAEEFAKVKQVPLGLVVPAMFTALSAATAGGVVVMPADGYEHGLAVYFVGVADPSERKSTVLSSVITKPLRRASKKVAAAGADELRAADAQVAVMARNLRKVEKDSDDAATIADAMRAHEEAEERRALLEPPNFIITDATPEALEVAMSKQSGVAAIVSAEGAFLENLAGRYGEGVSLSLLNQAWSREPIESRRVGRGEFTIDTPHLAMALLVQDTIAEKLSAPKFEGTGMLSRMFLTRPKSRVGGRTRNTDKMRPEVTDWWDATLYAILAAGWGRIDNPLEMTMDETAEGVANVFFAQAEEYAAAGGGISGWWGKATDMAVRVAALMTLASDPGAREIDGATMEAGVAVVRFFARETMEFYLGVIDPILGTENTRLYLRIERHIRLHYTEGDEFTSAALTRALKGGRLALLVTDVDPLLALLAEKGLIEEVQTKRKDSRKWRVLHASSEPESSDKGIIGDPDVGTRGLKKGIKKEKPANGFQQEGEHRDHLYDNPENNHIHTSLSFEASNPKKMEESTEVIPMFPLSEDGDLVWEWDGVAYPIKIYTAERHGEYLEFIKTHSPLGFDMETTGLRIFSGDTPRLAQFASADEAWVIDTEKYPEVVGQTFTIGGGFYAHNAGFDILVVAEHLGVPYATLKAMVFDTQMLSMLADPRGKLDGGTGHGLKVLCDHYLGEGASDSDAALKAEAKRLKIRVGDRFAEIPIDNEVYLTYAGVDAILVRRLGEVLRSLLVEEEIEHFPSIIPSEVETTDTIEEVVVREQRIATVAWDMKQRGIKIDRTAADHLHADLAQAEETAMAELAEHGVTSPNKNAEVIAAIEAEGVYELTARTGGGALSVASAVLDAAEAEGSDVARLVIAAKRAKRYRSVYVDGLLEYTDENDMLHPDISALRAITGRMSISNPPLQQIPADVDEVRNLFIPRVPGNRIVSADFSQIEARVLAALAGDEAFYDDVVGGDKAEGTDIHSQVAAIAFGDKFTEADRTMAKRIVFGKLYGGGIQTLARQSGATVAAATAIFTAFNERYKGVRDYASRLETRALAEGGFYLPSGRKVLIGENGGYKAMNYMIQGTARDLFVDAVLRLVDEGFSDRLLLPIHDEVLLELPSRGIKDRVKRVGAVMETTFGGVALPVGVGYGKTWGTAGH